MNAAADLVRRAIAPDGCWDVVVGEHCCMTLRQANKSGSTAMTTVLRRLIRDASRTRPGFVAHVAIHCNVCVGTQ